MPLDLVAPCKRILEEIITTSQAISCSALALANNRQNLDVSKRLRFQLEKIRTSADTILEAITEASLTEYTIDDSLIHWLFSGELSSCSAKLKEIDDVLKPGTGRATLPLQPLGRPTEDKLASAMALAGRHKNMFRFLTTPDIWNRERLQHQPSASEAPNVSALLVQEGTGSPGHGSPATSIIDLQHAVNVSPPSVDKEPVIRCQTESHRRMLEEVVRWLAAFDCTDKHKYMNHLRQKGTCKWFPNTDVYRKWRDRGAQFLWLHGKAGCGKSVLAASTIEHLKTTLRQEEVVVFFYFDFQNERSRSPTEMMRSLLSQLCCHLLELRVHPLDIPREILEKKGNGSLSLNDLDKLSDLVSRVANCFIHEPIVVIDALDECADPEPLLCTLVNLNSDCRVRLVVTSRPYRDMMSHFAELPSLSFEDMAEELAADIKSHIERELDLHGRLSFTDTEMKNEIHAKLTKNAEGRFRWVQCQLDVLKRCTTAQEVREALDNLPTELEATYERILDAIDERRLEGKLARRVLACLTVALKPLCLAQILDMLSIDFSLQGTTIRKTPELRAKLLDALSSLVTHYKETDVVSLSHFSVKEFLAGRTTLPMYQIVPCEAHAEVARSCMRYISAFIKQEPSRGNVSPSESWPMLPYVLSSGFNHLAYIDPESTEVLEALQTLGADVRHHPSHWDRLCQLREKDFQLSYPPWPSSRHDFVLYTLIAYASIELFHIFLSDHNPVKPRAGTNPLVYAADLRKTDHGTALLACSADVDVHGLSIDDSHHVSPLQVSIDRDDVVLVNELLQRGCLVTSQLLSYTICLPWCSARVLVQLTRTDEFAEWAHAIGDEKLYRSVFNSARPDRGDYHKTDEDHVMLARRLRQIGEDLSADSRFGRELIDRALDAAHLSMLEYLLPPDQPPPARFLLTASTGDTSETVSVVRFLLSKGVDTNVVSDGGKDTVLHLAARCPWEPRSLELIKMFTNTRFNPYTLNLRDETPLFIAAKLEHLTVVEHLLSSNTPIPSDILFDSLKRGLAPQMIQAIIRKGAVVISTFDGDTVLDLVITRYNEPTCLELMKRFIEAGYNPTTCDSRGGMALQTAIKHKYSLVIELLLSYDVLLPLDTLPIALERGLASQTIQTMVRKGADVNSLLNGDTVLHLAINSYSEPTCLELTKRFIEAGCNPTVCDSKGKACLYTAIKHGYISVVELLLSYDAPLHPEVLLVALQHRLAPQIIQTMVCKGANVNSTLDGDTILHYAISGYDEPTCLELTGSFIKAGCRLTTYRGANRKTALDTAIKHNYISVAELLLSYVSLPPDILPIALQRRLVPQLIKAIIRKGASVNSTFNGDTVLHLAITRYNEPICLELMKALINAGCNPPICNFNKKTFLDTAIRCDRVSVVEFLLSSSAMSLHPDVLPIALQRCSSPRMLHFLIFKGADITFTTCAGDTAVHLAITNYPEPVALWLAKNFIHAGCHPTAYNLLGKSALEVAFERGYTSVVENLPLPPDILLTALQRCSTPRLIQYLIQRGADVDYTTSNGDTMLHLAITTYPEFARLGLVKDLIKAGCNVSSCNSKGETALEVAIEYNSPQVVEFLLTKCNISLASDILPRALRKRSTPQMIKLLVDNGAHFHWGTVLEVADACYVGHVHEEIIKILNRKGKGKMRDRDSGDEMRTHAAKRLRLE